MQPSDTYIKDIWKGNDESCLARVSMSGSYITQATISSIQRTVIDITTRGAESQISSTALVVTNVVFDTLQTDWNWPYTTGYNFRDTVPGSNFAANGHTYQIEYKFTGSSGQVFYVVVCVRTKTIHGS